LPKLVEFAAIPKYMELNVVIDFGCEIPKIVKLWP